MAGLLAPLPVKNCWTIAEHAGDDGPGGMQDLIGRASWDDGLVRADVRDLSVTSLYQRLLTSFAVREVRKKADTHLRGDALDRAVAEQLYRLSVAAIGMFNRGRQDITEQELGADLHGLDPGGGPATSAESAGQRVLGEFFFVHAAEARIRQDQREVRRCYEFPHATFGEYLIASLVVETLADVADAADAAFGGARGPRVRERRAGCPLGEPCF